MHKLNSNDGLGRQGKRKLLEIVITKWG